MVSHFVPCFSVTWISRATVTWTPRTKLSSFHIKISVTAKFCRQCVKSERAVETLLKPSLPKQVQRQVRPTQKSSFSTTWPLLSLFRACMNGQKLSRTPQDIFLAIRETPLSRMPYKVFPAIRKTPLSGQKSFWPSGKHISAGCLRSLSGQKGNTFKQDTPCP